MNIIVTHNRNHFIKLGYKNFCSPHEMELPKEIAVDTETEGFDPRKDEIFSIQIGTGKNNYLIDLQKYNDCESITLEEIAPYLHNKILVFHNSAFDLSFFFIKGYFFKEVRDTMIASMIYYNGDPSYRHSFKDCMYRELRIRYDKSEQETINKNRLNSVQAIEYCFNDVDRLLDLHDVLLDKLIKYKSEKAYALHCKHIRALTYTELCGMPISSKKWKEKIEKDKKDFLIKERKVIDYIYDHIPKLRNHQLELFCDNNLKRVNVLLTSPAQMIQVFEALGINVTVEEKGVVKKSIEESVINKSNHEFVKLWLDLQKVNHNLTTFGENILDKIENERLYTKFKPLVDTARIASRKGEINFLNFPANEETRDCFECDDDHDIIVADFQGQETRCGADITQDKAMIDSVINGSDLHCAFARVLHPHLKSLSDEEIINNHKKERNSAKAPRFCFQFGGTGYTLHQNENIPLEEALNIEKGFKELHSGLYKWGNEKLKEALRLGYIEGTLGFKLRLPGYNEYLDLSAEIKNLDEDFWEKYKEGKNEYLLKKENSNYEIKNYMNYRLYLDNRSKISKLASLRNTYFKLCLNNPTQSMAAFQTKYATILLFEEIEKNNDYWDVKICNIIHDEIFIETIKSKSLQYKQILEDCMIKGGNYFLKDKRLRMEAEAKIGKSWYKAK